MPRTVLLRPTLLPGLTRLWRDRHTLQLGLDPARAVLLELADPATARLLDLLDGAHSERNVLEHATRIRVSREAAQTLLDTLRDAGLLVAGASLVPHELAEPARRRLSAEATALALGGSELPATPAQVLRRRRDARVLVTGAGRLGAPVSLALAQAGVGHVDPDLTGRVEPADLTGGGLLPDDLGRPVGTAVADAIARTAPGTITTPVRRGRASLVVQVGADRPAALLATAFGARRQVHLLVAIREGVPVIGPLVRPPVGPCLNCLDLHRQDRDPAWPALAAQLAADTSAQPCGTTTLLAAVAYAAAEVLTQLDGGTPETLGGAVEITSAGQFRRRSWPPHPCCGCFRRRGSRRTSPGQRRSAAAALLSR